MNDIDDDELICLLQTALKAPAADLKQWHIEVTLGRVLGMSMDELRGALKRTGFEYTHGNQEPTPDTKQAALNAAAPELYAVCERQRDIIEALQSLATAYRVGKRPSEKMFKILSQQDEVTLLAATVLSKARGE